MKFQTEDLATQTHRSHRSFLGQAREVGLRAHIKGLCANSNLMNTARALATGELYYMCLPATFIRLLILNFNRNLRKLQPNGVRISACEWELLFRDGVECFVLLCVYSLLRRPARLTELKLYRIDLVGRLYHGIFGIMLLDLY